MKKYLKQQVSKFVNNKKGSGEVALILLLMILGLFFLTKFVFKIPFPFLEDSKNDTEITQESGNNESQDK